MKGAQEGGASPEGDFPTAHTQILQQYQSDLQPVGTMPPPTRLKGVATAAKTAIKGQHATILLDKLGERLAFERSGTRLYDLLLGKFDLHGTWSGGPTRAELAEIRHDELQHFRLLSDCLRKLGSDPTVVTPCADVTIVESFGIHNVVADPRTNLAQSLHAILVAELADNAGWELLIELTDGLGYTDMASQFSMALVTEVEHLARVKRWTRSETRAEAGMSTAASPSSPAK